MSLAGKTICFTGTLSMARKEATAAAEGAGATVAGSVTGKVNVLVAGPGAGKKADDAAKKGIDVWTEEQFVAAIGGGGGASSSSTTTAAGKKKAAPPADEPAPKKAKAKADPPPASTAAGKKKAAPPAEEPPPKETKAKADPPTTTTSGASGRTPNVDRGARDLGASVYLDYDAKLNQAVVDGAVNSNKFYILQVLQRGSLFACWNRWGRVGEEGQTNAAKLQWGSIEGAIKDFEKKFKDKTANNWGDKEHFVKKTGKYQLVEVEDGDGDASSGAVLGKLTREQIEKGQAVLATIRMHLEKTGGASAPSSLTNDFYSLIPTISGRAKPPTINNYAILGEKEAQLEFWLRMGFEEMESTSDNPLEKLGAIACPPTLSAAAAGISDSGSVSSSVARGAKLAKSKAGNPSTPMNEHQYGAIVLYTGNSIYRALNEALRIKHVNVPRYLPYVKLFFSAAACMPKKAARLWRGIAADLYDEYEPGKVITWWTVSSTTADESVARNFMSQLGGKATLVMLDTQTAINIEPLSIYPHERESLLVPGTQLEVVKRSRSGNLNEIHVKEVGNALDGM